jgi:hypothetical protein
MDLDNEACFASSVLFGVWWCVVLAQWHLSTVSDMLACLGRGTMCFSVAQYGSVC